jgi:predicted AAA+ superfamily ATPase
VLVTGSARLDAFRRAGDALTGRTYFYRLHPIDVAESRQFLPDMSLEGRIRRLLQAGGFPEAFLNPDEAARLRNDRMELVTREDLRDLSRVSSWRGPADLVELLRERVGKPTNYDNLAQNLGISPPTSKAWVELLEKLYLVFLLPPFSSSLSRSIRKDRRVYFFDCAAAYDATGGARQLVDRSQSFRRRCQYRLEVLHAEVEADGIAAARSKPGATAGEVRNQAPTARQMARCVAVRSKAGEIAGGS